MFSVGSVLLSLLASSREESEADEFSVQSYQIWLDGQSYDTKVFLYLLGGFLPLLFDILPTMCWVFVRVGALGRDLFVGTAG